MKKIYLLSFLLFSLYSIFSQGYNIEHSTSLYQPVAFLSINLSDNNFSVGQTLYYNVYINYRDIYYIPNASLVIQIIQKMIIIIFIHSNLHLIMKYMNM